MRSLSSILSLFAVVALLMLGAGAAYASPQAMPCHEMGLGVNVMEGMTMNPAMTSDAPARPAKPWLVMACCVACVAPPLVQPPATTAAAPRPAPTSPALFDLPVGRSLSPEPNPPRT